jgi:hypothetical protein
MRRSIALPLLLILSCSNGLVDPELYEPLPDYDDLDFSLVEPSSPFLLWEIREGVEGGPHRVVASGGISSRDAVAAEVLAQFDAATATTGFDVGCLPGYCYKYVVTLQGSTVRTWNTVPQLVEFMGTINNEVEAAIVASAGGYYWGRTGDTGGIRDVFDGYELVVLRIVRFCAPVQTNRYVVVVSAAGVLRELRGEVWSRSSACI